MKKSKESRGFVTKESPAKEVVLRTYQPDPLVVEVPSGPVGEPNHR